VDDKFITGDEIALLLELREIRNRVAHSETYHPTPEDAERFMSLLRMLEPIWLVRVEAGKLR
jgi:hypothetical protein